MLVIIEAVTHNELVGDHKAGIVRLYRYAGTTTLGLIQQRADLQRSRFLGQQVLVLVNLQPRELKGILSQGMILMAEDATGALRLVQPSMAVKAGSMVG